MGCAQSRIENEETVSRCKARKNFMKEAVSARNAFASGHSGYSMALKNTGAALSDYGHGEAENHEPNNHRPLYSNSQPSIENLPPPPPLPNFSPVPPDPPLQRASTMPAELWASKHNRKNDSFTIIEDEDEDEDDEAIEEDGDSKGGGLRLRRSGRNEAPSPPQTPPLELKGVAWDYFFNVPGSDKDGNETESEVFDERISGLGNNVGLGGGGVEPRTPEKAIELSVAEEKAVKKAKQIVHSSTAPMDVRRGSKAVAMSSVSLVQILTDIDDHFLKASESAQEVSRMLEANRLHYHSNFADNRGHIDHAARVMRVITWNRSFKGMPNADGGKDDLDAEEHETHASVLDKLLAWETKLYDEVKAGELMKIEYQRKVALLNKQKKRGASSESLEKTKAAVSHLHTRYIVDMQSMDSTVEEVNHLRDDELYPKLVDLVNGMAKMWETMCIHHDGQLKLVTDLKSIDISYAHKETSKQHHERTIQLWNVIQEWLAQFEKLVTHQKQYIRALNSWLKFNLIPIESSLKEKIASPPRIQNPPIQALLHSWHDYIERCPDELAKTAISSFAAVIKTIIDHQEEEMKQMEKCEETRKEFLRKKQAFEEWYQKYMQRRTSTDGTDPDRSEDTNPKDPLSEKQFVVESLEKRLEEEMEAHQRLCVQVREKSLGSLKTRLPEIFRAMSDYCHDCSDTYERLRSITQSQNQNGGPS